jgi:hypothetical protein
MVLARWGWGGELVIEGQDLSLTGDDGETLEYEYALTIRPEEIPKVLRGLQAPESADVLDVLEQRGADLVRAGETRWMERHGVHPEFWARYG